MSTELSRRLLSSVVMVAALAIIAGLGAVISNEAFKPFLLEIGLSNSLASLVVVFLYQVLAFITNKISVPKVDDQAGVAPVKETVLI